MSDGRTHTNITYISAIFLFTLSYYLIGLTYSLFFIIAYIFAGLMFSGDLDTHSIQYKRWGFLRFIWLPYRKIFNHRSRFTHGAILGTFVRIIYLLTFLVLLLAIILFFYLIILYFMSKQNSSFFTPLFSQIKNSFSIFKEVFFNIVKKYPKYIFSVLVGLVLGALSHDLTDSIDSEIKSFRKKKKKKKRRLVKEKRKKRKLVFFLQTNKK